jgi:hypothetical protein
MCCKNDRQLGSSGCAATIVRECRRCLYSQQREVFLHEFIVPIVFRFRFLGRRRPRSPKESIVGSALLKLWSTRLLLLFPLIGISLGTRKRSQRGFAKCRHSRATLISTISRASASPGIKQLQRQHTLFTTPRSPSPSRPNGPLTLTTHALPNSSS